MQTRKKQTLFGKRLKNKLVNIFLVFKPLQNNLISGLPRVREKSGKLKFFQGQGLVREFCEPSQNGDG